MRANWNGSKWIRPEKRQRIYLRDRLTCTYCGVSMDEAHKGFTLDHVLPVELGGTNEAGNLVTACISCNSAKGKKTTSEFLAWLAEKGHDPVEIKKRIRRRLRRKLPKIQGA